MMTKRLLFFTSMILVALILAVPVSLAQSPTITVSGTLINKTTGEPAPGSIALMLHTFDGQQMSGMTDGVTADDGSFVFENVEASDGRLFEMMATVGNTSYFSDVAPAPTDGSALELPVNYFDATTDDSELNVSQMHMVVDFFSPSLMQIAEIYIISNNGDKTVENAIEVPDGQTAAVAFDLPAEAVNMSFDQGALGERFLQTENGFADTFGVQPGAETSQIIVHYYLPYEDGTTISHPLSYPTDHVNIIVPKMGVTFNGEAFALDSTREMGDGRMMDIYGTAPAGGPDFSFTVNGVPQLGQSEQPAADAAPTSAISGNNIRQIGIAVLVAGLLVLGTGVWWWKRNPVADDEVEMEISIPENLPAGSAENEIVQTLLQLDEALENGTISATEYDKQRTALRAELKTTLLQRRQPAAEPVAEVRELQ